MYLTILTELKPNTNTTLYHYRVSNNKSGVGYSKLGTTCELRTIVEDFKLKDIKFPNNFIEANIDLSQIK